MPLILLDQNETCNLEKNLNFVAVKNTAFLTRAAGLRIADPVTFPTQHVGSCVSPKAFEAISGLYHAIKDHAINRL